MSKREREPVDVLAALSRVVAELESVADVVPGAASLAEQAANLLAQHRRRAAEASKTLAGLPDRVVHMIIGFGALRSASALLLTSKALGSAFANAGDAVWSPLMTLKYPILEGLCAKMPAPAPSCRELMKQHTRFLHGMLPVATPRFKDVIFSFRFGAVPKVGVDELVANDPENLGAIPDEWDADRLESELEDWDLDTSGSEAELRQRLQERNDRSVARLQRECDGEWGYPTAPQTLVLSYDDGVYAGGELTFPVPTTSSIPLARLFGQQRHENCEEHYQAYRSCVGIPTSALVERSCPVQVLLTDRDSGAMCLIDTRSMQTGTGFQEEDYFHRRGDGDEDTAVDEPLRWVFGHLENDRTGHHGGTCDSCILYARACVTRAKISSSNDSEQSSGSVSDAGGGAGAGGAPGDDTYTISITALRMQVKESRHQSHEMRKEHIHLFTPERVKQKREARVKKKREAAEAAKAAEAVEAAEAAVTAEAAEAEATGAATGQMPKPQPELLKRKTGRFAGGSWPKLQRWNSFTSWPMERIKFHDDGIGQTWLDSLKFVQPDQ
jgi:hypothetical protein